MKRIALILSLLPLLAMATSTRPETDEVAPTLAPVAIQNIAREGKVMRSQHQHPFTDLLIAIPAEVSTASVCVDFVGQQTTGESEGSSISITALGASNPLQQACIEIFPMPVKTQLTFNMRILTGGFVPAGRYHRKVVNFTRGGSFLVTYDMQENRVSVEPMLKHVMH